MKDKKKISWNEYFMMIANISRLRSSDPNTQNGCCIVDKNNRIIGIGYNGFPRGLDDFPWDRDKDWLDTKYPYVVHAEANAIMNTSQTQELKGASIYTTLFPCNECAKLIIQAGIKCVYYCSDKYEKLPAFIAGRKLLEAAKVSLVYFPISGCMHSEKIEDDGIGYGGQDSE